MYTIFVSFRCHPGKREEYLKRVRGDGIIDAVLCEDGCRCYDYYIPENDPNHLLLIEAWDSKEHQQIHIGQPHMEHLRSFKDEYIASTTLGEFQLK